MEIKLGGEFVVSKKPDEVYAFLVDPNRFCPLLPDYESLTIQDDKTFLVKLRVGISHIRGTAAMKLALAEAVNPTHPLYEGQRQLPPTNAPLPPAFDLRPP